MGRRRSAKSLDDASKEKKSSLSLEEVLVESLRRKEEVLGPVLPSMAREDGEERRMVDEAMRKEEGTLLESEFRWDEG